MINATIRAIMFGSGNRGFVAQAPVASWDITTSEFTGNISPALTEDATPSAFTLSADGTKMYMVGWNSSTIYQYTLSTAWDISTATYDTVSKSISPASLAGGMTISSDGTKMIITSQTGLSLYQFTFGTPWDLSGTFTYDTVSLDISGESTSPRSINFSTDGTKIYLMDSSLADVFQYTLPTPWTLTAGSYASKSIDTGTEDLSRYGMYFSTDGTKMFVPGYASDAVYQYTLGTAWDISTTTYASKLFDLIPSGVLTSLDIHFSADGVNMYVRDDDTAKIYQYRLDQPVQRAIVSPLTLAKDVTGDDVGNYVMVGDGGAAYSSDKETWTLSASTFTAEPVAIDTDKAGNWVLLDVDGDMYTSTDNGVTWTARTSPSYALMTRVTYHQSVDKFYATGNTEHMVSTDSGVTWSPLVTGYNDLQAVAAGDSLVLMSGPGGQDTYTSDGLTWSSPGIPGFPGIVAGAYGNGIWTLAESGGNIDHSLTGTGSWTQTNIDLALNLTPGIIFYVPFEDRWITSGADVADKWYESADLSAWTEITTGDFVGLDNGLRIAIDDSGYVMLSKLTNQITIKNTDPDAWTVSTATYNSDFISAATESSNANGISFKPDGTKMYVLDYDGVGVYQYTLSPAWDVSTANYDSKSKDVSNEESQCQALEFGADGTKMYITGLLSDHIYQYTLSTAWDVSTAGVTDGFYNPNLAPTPSDMTFNDDGTKMYVLDTTSFTVYQYSLTTPWDVTGTVTDDNKTKLVNEDGGGTVGGIFFNPSGTQMFMLGSTGDKVYQYTLVTPWDVSTATYDTVSKYVGGEDLWPVDVVFSPDGSKMFIMGKVANTIYAYDL